MNLPIATGSSQSERGPAARSITNTYQSLRKAHKGVPDGQHPSTNK
jgi:hypothetical protein